MSRRREKCKVLAFGLQVRIDAALALIQNADPTGESQADSDELLHLEGK